MAHSRDFMINQDVHNAELPDDKVATFNMPHSKTPGGQAASDKFQKQQAEAKGLGADNAPGHKEASKPGEAPVAGDSYMGTVGVDNGTNQPGEAGNVGAPAGEMGSQTTNQGNLK